MSPSLALLIWLVLLLALFRRDPAREPNATTALWLPVIWLSFMGSRTPTQWLGLSWASNATEALEEGSPLDRVIFSFLILLIIITLAKRSFRWNDFVTQNSAVALFLTFSLLSVVWSDFPFATFKKWFRDAGVYMAVMVVLSDPRPVEAVSIVLRRVCYLLVPLSVILVKYYPYLGRTYSAWGGVEITGVSTSKNQLGVLCLVSGIFFFWDTVVRWHQRRELRVKRAIQVNVAFMGMTLWLLNQCGSKTSTVCLIMGCLVVVGAHSKFGRRHPGWLKALAPMGFVVYLILTLGFGMGAELSEAVGGSANMSDRTHIWEVLLSVPINPVLGTGYQSFWLGWRTAWAWARLNGDNVQSAHNGYLQTYLDLGLIGLFLLCAFLVATYRNVCKRIDPLTPFGSLGFGLWTVLLFYNVSEGAFQPCLIFVTFLMGSLAVTQPLANQARGRTAAPPGLGGPTGISLPRMTNSVYANPSGK
jgi:O-antigen ligase